MSHVYIAGYGEQLTEAPYSLVGTLSRIIKVYQEYI